MFKSPLPNLEVSKRTVYVWTDSIKCSRVASCKAVQMVPSIVYVKGKMSPAIPKPALL
jgi:hypothetical protein